MAGRNLFAEGAIAPPGEAEEGQPLFTDAPVQEQPVVQPAAGQPAIQEQPAEELPEGTALDVILEPAQAIVSGLGTTIAGGVAGAVSAPFVGAEKAADIVRSAQEAGAEFGAPETKRGAAALETFGDLMEAGIDLARFPISGLAGLAELISGQGLEQATKTIRDVQEKGVGQTAGDRVFEATGDPLYAAAAATSPEIVASIIPITKLVKGRRALKLKLADKVKAASAQPELSTQIKSITGGVKDGTIGIESATKALDQLDAVIKNKSGLTVASKVAKISDDVKKGGQLALEKLDDLADEVAAPAPEKSLAKFMVSGAGKVKADSVAKETIKQGFDQGVIAAVKGASKVDRVKMSKMVEIMQKGKENALFAMKNRPSDIAGNSLLDRLNHVKTINREAGKQIDDVAKSLRGKPVDSSTAVNNFMNNLDEMGIRLDNRFRPNFKGSDIDGLSGPQLAIANMVKRMSSGRRGVQPDAFELHRMKRFIDENVTYGKAGEGLKGKTEGVLKQLRRDLDTTLDNKFTEYNNVNTRYSDTINALDALQDVAGKKMDLFGPNAEKATGTLLRRMMSNAQSRVNLVDAVDDLDSISRKYGGVFDDDIATQMLFVDELDSVFGPVARTSLAGETAKGIKAAAPAVLGQKTAAGVALEAGAALAEKARGINIENAFKSITELLKRE